MELFLDLGGKWVDKLAGHITYVLPFRFAFGLELKIQKVTSWCCLIPKIIRFKVKQAVSLAFLEAFVDFLIGSQESDYGLSVL